MKITYILTLTAEHKEVHQGNLALFIVGGMGGNAARDTDRETATTIVCSMTNSTTTIYELRSLAALRLDIEQAGLAKYCRSIDGEYAFRPQSHMEFSDVIINKIGRAHV